MILVFIIYVAISNAHLMIKLKEKIRRMKYKNSIYITFKIIYFLFLLIYILNKYILIRHIQKK